MIVLTIYVHIPCTFSRRILFACPGFVHKAPRTALRLSRFNKKTAIFVYNDCKDRTTRAVSNMIHSLQWESLYIRRKKARLTMLYMYIKLIGG